MPSTAALQETDRAPANDAQQKLPETSRRSEARSPTAQPRRQRTQQPPQIQRHSRRQGQQTANKHRSDKSERDGQRQEAQPVKEHGRKQASSHEAQNRPRQRPGRRPRAQAESTSADKCTGNPQMQAQQRPRAREAPDKKRSGSSRRPGRRPRAAENRQAGTAASQLRRRRQQKQPRRRAQQTATSSGGRRQAGRRHSELRRHSAASNKRQRARQRQQGRHRQPANAGPADGRELGADSAPGKENAGSRAPPSRNGSRPGRRPLAQQAGNNAAGTTRAAREGARAGAHKESSGQERPARGAHTSTGPPGDVVRGCPKAVRPCSRIWPGVRSPRSSDYGVNFAGVCLLTALRAYHLPRPFVPLSTLLPALPHSLSTLPHSPLLHLVPRSRPCSARCCNPHSKFCTRPACTPHRPDTPCPPPWHYLRLPYLTLPLAPTLHPAALTPQYSFASVVLQISHRQSSNPWHTQHTSTP